MTKTDRTGYNLMMLRIWTLILVVFAPQQGIEKARAPEPRKALPPVQEPFRSPVERRDLIQRFRPRSPLEGFYKLQRVVRPGQLDVTEASGYLVIGRTHLSLNLQTTTPDQPQMIQAGFRTYTIQDDRIVMTALIGHTNEGNQIVLDPPGLTETRRFRLGGSVLRIFQTNTAYMEFVRLE